MRELRIAAAQFEARDGDLQYNLGRVEELTRRAAGDQGAQWVCFHEGCLSGYTFVQPLSRADLTNLAEPVPDGPGVRALERIARECGVVVAAGLFERDGEDLYNCYVVVSPQGFVEKFRKLHPFVSPFLTPGDGYCVFDLLGWKVGILICYDNNLPENVRMTTLLGAEIVLMPHVTCGLPSVMPGRGKIDPAVWENRHRDPVRCRQEFSGPKGRGWLMRWLPARAYENGIYAVFTNAVGVDHDTIKTGNAMVLDPYGEILVESHALGDDVVTTLVTEEKLHDASGRRYIRARRPELYGKLSELLPPGEKPVTAPGWTLARPEEKSTESESEPESEFRAPSSEL